MGTVKTVQVVDSKGNKIVVNEEDAGQYKKAPASRVTHKPKRS
tara:strand:- start:3478 stop:3606 length:129 start_codon:yes stop_codon:yes gene_type:complete